MKKQLLKKLYAFIFTAMLFSVSANAQIVYTDVNPDDTISQGTYNLDLNNHGTNDFEITHYTTTVYCTNGQPVTNNYITVSPLGTNQVACDLGNNVTKIALNANINATALTWNTSANQLMASRFYNLSACTPSNQGGQWINAVDGYLGLKLTSNGNTYYGWARLNTFDAYSCTIMDYAYNTIPNQPILAGETSCIAPSVALTSSGPLSFCSGGNVQLNAITNFAYMYQWFKDGSVINSADTSFYTASIAGAYHVIAGNSCGYAISTDDSVFVFAAVNTSVTVSGDTLTANATTATYQWIDCSTMQIIPGATAQTFSPSQSGIFAVIVTENSCSATSSCYSVANAQIVYTDVYPDVGSGASNPWSYNLDLNNDGTNDFVITRSTSQINCNGPKLNSYISVTPLGTNQVACFSSGNSATKMALNANINASVLTWNNSANLLMAAKTINLACMGTTSGQWVSPAGDGYLGLKLIIGSNIYYGWARLWVSSFVTSFAIRDYACNTIPNQPILAGETFCTPPTVALTSSGPLSFCNGDSVQLNAMTNSVYLYQWFKDGNMIIGADTSFHTTTSAGAYNVVVGNSCGYNTSAMDTVVIHSLPTAMITSSGPTTFCQGGNVVLHATTGSGYTYQWGTGAGPMSGATDSSYTANTSGTYSVVVTNSNNCSASATPITAVVDTLPTVTLSPSGPIILCNGEGVQLTAITNSINQYQWFKDGNAIPGADTSYYTASSAGAYYVEVGNSCGNANSTVDTLSVFVNNISVTASGSTLTSNATSAAFQWMDCSTIQIIPGATSQTFSPSQGGTFAVIVTENGCSDT